MRTFGRLITVVTAGGACLALCVAALVVPIRAAASGGATGVPNAVLDIFRPQAARSVVYAADGSVLAVLHATENRSPVSLAQVPQVLIDAVVDTEDARFFSHGGVDFRAIGRAAASDVRSGKAVQGASTITEQLVKTVLNTPGKTLDRKIRDAVIATRVEAQYSKPRILEAYLNTVYFGNGAYGVQAAAETYFNVDVSQLGAVQAALLAGIIRDPQQYDPFLNAPESSGRRNFVLHRMAAQGHLGLGQADRLAGQSLPAQLTVSRVGTDSNDGYYVEQVKNILLNRSSILGSSYSERYDALFKGGLKIYTNLDPHLQDLAERSVAQRIPANPQGFTGALVSMEPSTGKVKALVGGPAFESNRFDLATQGLRQPGSGFKLFTLLAAYEAGYVPNDFVDGSSPCAVRFGSNSVLLTKPIHNDEGRSAGPLPVVAATAGSVNCAFIRMAHEVGLAKVVEVAHRLGLAEPFPLNPSLVIGSEETTVLEMAGAYATLAADGVYHRPQFIDRIVDRYGATIDRADTAGTRVLDPQISREAVETLRAVVQFGTGVAADLGDRAVAGKTGTTESNTDAWFNGFTPQLATTVWMGDPKGRTPMYNVGGITVFGGTYPARIWHDFTAAALAGQPAVAFPAPANRAPGGRMIDSPGLRSDQPFTSVFSGPPATRGPAGTAPPVPPVLIVPSAGNPPIPPVLVVPSAGQPPVSIDPSPVSIDPPPVP